MPELPEVETTRRGIEPLLAGRVVTRVCVREPRLRWRVPTARLRKLLGNPIASVARRGKYLLLASNAGTVIVHLGMSGSLRVVPCETPPQKADHVDLVLDDGNCLRLRDPRRFGTVLWTQADPSRHRLLAGLGPEPLGDALTADYLFRQTRGRRRAIRDLLLDSRVIAGIGNIYANEALFASAIRPARAARRLTHADCARLARSIKETLRRALRAGGTTLRDFQRADGRPGFFQQRLRVYGRAGQPCGRCHTPVRRILLGQRGAFFCPRCQL